MIWVDLSFRNITLATVWIVCGERQGRKTGSLLEWHSGYNSDGRWWWSGWSSCRKKWRWEEKLQREVRGRNDRICPSLEQGVGEREREVCSILPSEKLHILSHVSQQSWEPWFALISGTHTGPLPWWRIQESWQWFTDTGRSCILGPWLLLLEW